MKKADLKINSTIEIKTEALKDYFKEEFLNDLIIVHMIEVDQFDCSTHDNRIFKNYEEIEAFLDEKIADDDDFLTIIDHELDGVVAFLFTIIAIDDLRVKVNVSREIELLARSEENNGN